MRTLRPRWERGLQLSVEQIVLSDVGHICLYSEQHLPSKPAKQVRSQTFHLIHTESSIFSFSPKKVLVYTYCALNATAPNYLVQLINHRNVTRTLRSGSSTELLFVPTSRTVTYGDRCFAVASPILWNNLPVSLRTAKCLTILIAIEDAPF